MTTGIDLTVTFITKRLRNFSKVLSDLDVCRCIRSHWTKYNSAQKSESAPQSSRYAETYLGIWRSILHRNSATCWYRRRDAWISRRPRSLTLFSRVIDAVHLRSSRLAPRTAHRRHSTLCTVTLWPCCPSLTERRHDPEGKSCSDQRRPRRVWMLAIALRFHM